MRSEARVTTPNASRYVKQLCKHFAHEATAEWDGQQGTAEFDKGSCRLSVDDGFLHVVCMSDDEAGLDEVEEILRSHLAHFAHKEGGLPPTWTRS